MTSRNDEKTEKIEKTEFTPFEKKLMLEPRGGEPAKIGCPMCGDPDNLVPDGRCVYCMSCGWGRCSL